MGYKMDPATMMMLATLAGGALSGLGGSKGEKGSTYNKGQLSAIDDILNSIQGMRGGGAEDVTQQPGYQQGNDWLMSMFNDPEFFKNFEAPLQRNFQEQTVPELANRFASQGSGGSLGSTGFRNQLAREGSNLHTNIAALRGGMQQQAIPQMLGYAQQPFSNMMSMYQQALQPTQNTYQPPNAGFFGNIMPAFAGGAAQGYGQQMGQNFAGNGNQPGDQQGNALNGATARYAGQSPSTY